jgi:hypothetical protein
MKASSLLMKRLPVFFFLTAMSLTTFGQVIRGIVLDKANRDTLSFAMVYINGTFVGTYTDAHGRFALDITGNTGMPLTVSAMGYYSQTYTDYSPSRPLFVFLSPKVVELEEVVISAKANTARRTSNMKVFRREFLGTTSNALDCEILNERDITFNYDSDRDTLKAYALKPIEIHNKALGYKITYFLDKFEYYRSAKTFIFKGSIVFKEDLTGGMDEREAFARKRRYAYLGSRMHFFRSLWRNDLEAQGFNVRNWAYDNLEYDRIVANIDGRKYFRFSENVGICYFTKMPESTVVFLKDMVYFDEKGYFDPSGISWEGKMATQRIADWLPYEYGIR